MSLRVKLPLTPVENIYTASIFIIGPLISVLDMLTVSVTASLTTLFLNNSTEISTYEVLPGFSLNQSSLIAILLTLFLVRTFLRAGRVLMEANFRRVLSERITEQIFETQIFRQSRHIDKRDSAELLRDLDAVPRFLNCYLFSRFIIFEETILMTGIILVITFHSTVEGLAILSIVALLLYLVVRAFSKKIEQAGNNSVTHRTKRIQFSLFIFRSLKEIALYGKEKSAVKLFRVHLTGAKKAERQYELVSGTSALAIEVIVVTAAILALWVTSIVMGDRAGALSGSLVIAASAFRVIPGISRLAYALQERKFEKSQADILINYLNPSTASASSRDEGVTKVQTLDELQSAHAQAGDATEITIELQNLTFAYSPNEPQIISNLNHMFQTGLLHVIRGDSGNGKSTLLSLIMGNNNPQDGQILVNQVPLKSSEIFNNLQIAYVPQSVAALDYSLADNITLAFGGDEVVDESILWSAINAAGLSEFVESLPDGLSTNLGEFGSKVSGGQLQRIGLARALYRRPRVLLLDEATSNLDYEIENKILKDLANTKNQLLIIIVSHSDRVAEFADKILELS